MFFIMIVNIQKYSFDIGCQAVHLVIRSSNHPLQHISHHKTHSTAKVTQLNIIQIFICHNVFVVVICAVRLFAGFVSLRPSQHYFSSVGKGLPGLNQY